MISTADFRNGMVVVYKDSLMELVDFQHVKPGKGPAFVRTKLKDVLTGRVLENTFRSGEKMEEVRLVHEPYQYLYTDGNLFHFMHRDTFEQIPVGAHVVEECKKWMKENQDVDILFHGSDAIRVELPANVELLITKSDPGVQGDRAQGGTKIAELETGATVQVPLFLNEGEMIRVDTRSGEYLERASS